MIALLLKYKTHPFKTIEGLRHQCPLWHHSGLISKGPRALIIPPRQKILSPKIIFFQPIFSSQTGSRTSVWLTAAEKKKTCLGFSCLLLSNSHTPVFHYSDQDWVCAQSVTEWIKGADRKGFLYYYFILFYFLATPETSNKSHADSVLISVCWVLRGARSACTPCLTPALLHLNIHAGKKKKTLPYIPFFPSSLSVSGRCLVGNTKLNIPRVVLQSQLSGKVTTAAFPKLFSPNIIFVPPETCRAAQHSCFGHSLMEVK